MFKMLYTILGIEVSLNKPENDVFVLKDNK